MSWDNIGYLAWLRKNAAAVRDALGVGAGTGDVVAAGQPGGQAIQGASNGTGTLTLRSGSASPVVVDGDIQANVVRTGDLLMESRERNARWRFIEHRGRIQVVNEITNQDLEIVILDPDSAALLRRLSQGYSLLRTFFKRSA